MTIYKQVLACGSVSSPSNTFIPSTKANHAQSKNAFDSSLDLSFLLCSQFSSLVNFQGSNRETCLKCLVHSHTPFFSSKPGSLHSTLTWHLRDCDLWPLPRTLTGCCPVSGSVLSWFSLFATWDSGSPCQQVLGCVFLGCVCLWWIVECGGFSYMEEPLFDLCLPSLCYPGTKTSRQDLLQWARKHFKT